MAEGINPVGDQDQPRQQTGQQQIRLGVDERNMRTTYSNAFRTNATPEEVMLDFGINTGNPAAQQQQQQGQQQNIPEIIFQVNERVIVNWFSAKRLAITLSQLVRRHEEQFGELEMDPNKRQKK